MPKSTKNDAATTATSATETPEQAPAPSLRERQHERVRSDLRAAFIALAVERGVHAFSLHDVAQAAGVSDRTLYRYFPSREELIDDVSRYATGTVDAAQRKSGAMQDDAFDHPEAVAGAFEVFEEHSDLVRTSASIRDAGLDDQRRDARTGQVREFLAAEGVGPEALDELVTLVRMLTGAEGWLRMTSDEFGLGSRESGLAAHWAVQVLVDAARQLDGPLRPTFPSDDDGDDGHD